MNAENFRNSWRDTDQPLAVMDAETLVRFKMLPETHNFLTITGLPVYASPFLSFIDNTKRFTTERYIVIGAGRNGDPIVIDTGNKDQVEQLSFQSAVLLEFVNSSIGQLAEFLIIYRDFEDALIAEQGDDGVLNSSFTDEQFEGLKNRMLEVDEKALQEDSFWKKELDILLEDRADYLSE